jgi:hypothetical protein
MIGVPQGLSTSGEIQRRSMKRRRFRERLTHGNLEGAEAQRHRVEGKPDGDGRGTKPMWRVGGGRANFFAEKGLCIVCCRKRNAQNKPSFKVQRPATLSAAKEIVLPGFGGMCAEQSQFRRNRPQGAGRGHQGSERTRHGCAEQSQTREGSGIRGGWNPTLAPRVQQVLVGDTTWSGGWGRPLCEEGRTSLFVGRASSHDWLVPAGQPVKAHLTAAVPRESDGLGLADLL